MMIKIIIQTATKTRDGAITGEATIEGEKRIYIWRETDNHPLSDTFREAIENYVKNGGIIEPYIPTESETLNDEKTALLKLLADTDYKAIKATENGASLAEKYPELAAQRQAARERINAIDERLTEIEKEENNG
ncbi:MAG: hypothetical protein LBQ52_04670 [Helicobacteraceae bacterium]|jgi:hypothetical protein|nr:hypothetical protein [Helicobacteraceae bacterium]